MADQLLIPEKKSHPYFVPGSGATPSERARELFNQYCVTAPMDERWETEVWLAETPDHLIHFNGEKFLGPAGSES